MSDNPASPLLGGSNNAADPDDNPRQSARRKPANPHHGSTNSDESTPLLARERTNSYYGDDGSDNETASVAGSYDGRASISSQNSGKTRRKLKMPTIIALALLSILMIAIICFGFAVPEAVKEYAETSAQFEPTRLSIDSFTEDGLNARIEGNFMLNGSRVHKKPVRDLGRFGTWIANKVETRPSTVEVSLPEYGNLVLGTADIPKLVVSIRDGSVTHLDFIVGIKPGKTPAKLRDVIDDLVAGRLGQLRLHGQANVGLKSGIFPLGSQSISQTFTFDRKDAPELPKYDIEKINVHEIKMPDGSKAMSADVSVSAFNELPLSFDVPPIAFDVRVPGCSKDEPFILLAKATAEEMKIRPNTTVVANARGVVRHLPDKLLKACPDSGHSPLDSLLGDYLNGGKTTLFISGASEPAPGTPKWIADIARDLVVPFPITGRSMGNIIRSFALENVHFGMPDPSAEPGSPEAEPKISADVKVIANLPNEINFPVDVSHVRALANISYKGSDFGVLDLHEWMDASSKRIEPHDGLSAGLEVTADIENAPVNITDSDVFAEVVGDMLLGGKIVLDISADIDIQVATALGELTLKDIPAKGHVPIHLPKELGDFKGFQPKIGDLEIVDTSPSAVFLSLKANVTNPTNYSATVPYVNINILNNGSVMAQAVVRNIECGPGVNDNIPVNIEWDPRKFGGAESVEVARELISKYISGSNTTLTFKTHAESFPAVPLIGIGLSHFQIEAPTPKLGKNPDDEGHFINDTVMHLVSSTATFTLLSPLQKSTLFLTSVNATAYYNHTEPVGVIEYEEPFAVPPGSSESPQLPVDWSLDGVGYDAIKDALGGTLKLDAVADVGVRIGEWEENIHFIGRGIGARIAL